MSPVFFFRDGDLWHRDYWWARDDMERQARHFERRLAEQPTSDFYREMVRQCRDALTKYDRHHQQEQAA